MPEPINNDFPPQYDPKPVEARWYRFWEESGFFTANPNSPKPKFSIVIPPPNITGSLHVGHALNNSLQDAQIRFKKLQGFETLWLPGTDHASIGTHTHIDRALAAEGTDRFKLGREEFLKRAWAWKEKYGSRIIEQLKLLGCACDWTRTRFTMDEMLSRAVREAFVRYYEDGLIYRGTRIVNWCPRCHTAVSDLEVKHQDQHSHWWYIRYPLVEDEAGRVQGVKGSGVQVPDPGILEPQNPGTLSYIVVATTRPETMLGDTAVAVNPEDERFGALVGTKLKLPLTDRLIPVVADSAVEKEFGTGAVKVAPAHDATDFEIGKRHNLEFITVIDEDARMTDKVPERYQGLSREEARKRVVEDLEAQGLIEKIEPYKLSASTCERCGTVVEPLISEQWFVRMQELAKPAIEVVETGRVKFIPERWNKVYLDWMYNIRDWCISRQLWWGHRIPVWYCDCGELIVSRTNPTECPKCHSKNLRQDEDVLDTWFSSALWPFSTLGWPEKTPDLAKFYPTDFLSTAPDIIFLWVARMVFSGMKFMGDIPFSNVYFHSFILVESGERMSRSKGIGIDPVDMFQKYGTDAVRFTLAYLESQSQSYRLSEKRFEFGRNFTNKVWNACRLIAPHLREGSEGADIPSLQFEDAWIISRYNRTVEATTGGLDACAYSAVASRLYEFFWHDLCDWYLEFAKLRLKADDAACRWTLHHVLRGTLQLLHPFMPFITEELWGRLGFGRGQGVKDSRGQVPDTGILESSDPRILSIMQSRWPEPIPADDRGIERVETMRELIVAVRNIRAEMEVPAKTDVRCIVNSADAALAESLRKSEGLIKELASVAGLEFGSTRPEKSSVAVLPGCEIYVPLEGVVDVEKELDRMKKEIANLEKVVAGIDAKFANPDFAARAKPEVVEAERGRRAEFASKLERMRTQLESWR